MTSPRSGRPSEVSQRAASLPVDFFTRPAQIVARELLGAIVVSTLGHARTAGRIIETEAYLGYDDPASHGYLGRRNDKNAALFGVPGSWYVYRSYGLHWCANLVCESAGRGSAVLLRALAPIDGIVTMRRRRGVVAARVPANTAILCSGPGKLCQALGITCALDGRMMPASSVIIVPGEAYADGGVDVTPRIGITKAADWPLRFVIKAETKRPPSR